MAPAQDDEEKALRRAFGGALREARKAAGLSAQALATLIGDKTSASTVTRWETGERPPNADAIARFARETRQPIDKLLARTVELLGEHAAEEAKQQARREASRRSKPRQRRPQSH